MLRTRVLQGGVDPEPLHANMIYGAIMKVVESSKLRYALPSKKEKWFKTPKIESETNRSQIHWVEIAGIGTGGSLDWRTTL